MVSLEATIEYIRFGSNKTKDLASVKQSRLTFVESGFISHYQTAVINEGTKAIPRRDLSKNPHSIDEDAI